LLDNFKSLEAAQEQPQSPIENQFSFGFSSMVFFFDNKFHGVEKLGARTTEYCISWWVVAQHRFARQNSAQRHPRTMAPGKQNLQPSIRGIGRPGSAGGDGVRHPRDASGQIIIPLFREEPDRRDLPGPTCHSLSL